MNDKDWQPHEDVSRTAYVVGLERKVEELEAEQHHKVKEALANSDACWRMEQEVIVRQRDEAAKERDRARQACNACWHDLERIVSLCERIADEDPLKIAERMMRERDEALAQVARREREHEALLETAQKALAHVEAERDLLKNHYSPEAAAKLRAELASARAEIEMLRGVGCREAKEGEPESGPCGVCLRCAEERGAKWALERHGNPFASKTLGQYAQEICRNARSK